MMSRSRLSFLHNGLLLLVSTLALIGGAVGFQQTQRAPSPAPPAATQPVAPVVSDAIDRPTSEPYKGSLSIFEDPQRGEKLQINRVMDVLGIKEGSHVADIGAGSGWFTVRAARRAGGTGEVYAVEINEDYLKHISERAAKEQLPNVRTILGKEDDPLLPAESIDAALLLKTYHEIAQPIRLLRNTRKAMRPDALLGIIDRNGDGADHGLNRDKVVREAERAGFVLTEEYDFVKPDGMDYFLVFRAK
ncbi:MAG: class I SAM-dependent methyltransferase [Acidobacteria bacterium]|nr:class I SAM-dependent methyltransferase [Acidobacteriota bacterium]MDQ3755115.1 class I SAM-dependent methyltransferase [Acidobacteriota bacterium]